MGLGRQTHFELVWFSWCHHQKKQQVQNSTEHCGHCRFSMEAATIKKALQPQEGLQSKQAFPSPKGGTITDSAITEWGICKGKQCEIWSSLPAQAGIQAMAFWPESTSAQSLSAALVDALVASRDVSWIPAGTTSAGEGESSQLATEPRAAAITHSMPD